MLAEEAIVNANWAKVVELRFVHRRLTFGDRIAISIGFPQYWRSFDPVQGGAFFCVLYEFANLAKSHP
jgi:hypothetical protein